MTSIVTFVRTAFRMLVSLTVAQLYDCELLHIENPNRHDSHSPPVVHCGCDPQRPSRKHVHINDPPEVKQAILAMKKERDGGRDRAYQRERSAPQPPAKLPASTVVASKALSPPPHSPRKRTGHVSRRPENIPTAPVTSLNEAGAQVLPKDHGPSRALAESSNYQSGMDY